MRMPAAMIVVLSALFVADVIRELPRMPDTVASHFDLAGRADGWMPRGSFAAWILVLGLGLPALMLLVFAYATRMPRRWLQLPSADHWLAPERIATTRRRLLGHGLWLVVLLQALLLAMHRLTVAANAAPPPARLDPRALLVVLAGFGLGVAVWAVRGQRRFAFPDPDASTRT